MEPESSFAEIELEVLESRTAGIPTPGWGKLRILESLTPGNIVPGWNGKMKPPESPADPRIPQQKILCDPPPGIPDSPNGTGPDGDCDVGRMVGVIRPSK